MTPSELKLIKQIADDAATCRQLLATHTTNIENIFAELRTHADKITVVQTKQDMCIKRNAPGNKSERASVLAAIVFGVVAILMQVVNYFK